MNHNNGKHEYLLMSHYAWHGRHLTRLPLIPLILRRPRAGGPGVMAVGRGLLAHPAGTWARHFLLLQSQQPEPLRSVCTNPAGPCPSSPYCVPLHHILWAGASRADGAELQTLSFSKAGEEPELGPQGWDGRIRQAGSDKLTVTAEGRELSGRPGGLGPWQHLGSTFLGATDTVTPSGGLGLRRV